MNLLHNEQFLNQSTIRGPHGNMQSIRFLFSGSGNLLHMITYATTEGATPSSSIGYFNSYLFSGIQAYILFVISNRLPVISKRRAIATIARFEPARVRILV